MPLRTKALRPEYSRANEGVDFYYCSCIGTVGARAHAPYFRLVHSSVYGSALESLALKQAEWLIPLPS